MLTQLQLLSFPLRWKIKTVQGQSKRLSSPWKCRQSGFEYNKQASCSYPEKNHCFIGYKKQHLLAACLEGECYSVWGPFIHRAPKQPQHGNRSSKYLQLKGTALSQKFNKITGDVFPSEKWAIQNSAGGKRWLKREGNKKKRYKKKKRKKKPKLWK